MECCLCFQLRAFALHMISPLMLRWWATSDLVWWWSFPVISLCMYIYLAVLFITIVWFHFSLQVVPYHFRSRLNMSTGKFLTGHCPKFLMFKFYLQKEEERTYICGAYWRSFTMAYNIQLNDVVKFSRVSLDSLFDVTMLGIGGCEKPLHERPGIWIMLNAIFMC